MCTLSMDKQIQNNRKRRNRSGETPSGSNTFDSNSSNFEGTFIQMNRPSQDTLMEGPKFVNPRFEEADEDDTLVQVINYESEERAPLQLLFPDLDSATGKKLMSEDSTTEITRMLVGKKADFSFLRPSRRLSSFPPLQGRMPPLIEVSKEDLQSSSHHLQAD